MELGRDDSKHISCQYEDREDECPKECSKCAISIKTDGDVALASNRLDEAIKQYKKALFVEPKFAEAWCNLANAYGMKSEYNNALRAFDKAIAIDPKYGKALFGKAITLRNLGRLDEAMKIANEILDLYDNSTVVDFKKKLIDAGVQDKGSIIDKDKAFKALQGKAGEIMRNNNLLDDNNNAVIIEEIFHPEEFTKSVFLYCSKKYASLGIDKVRGEYIITSFYGSICTTLFYKADAENIIGADVFDYLNNHIDVEFTDVAAEKMLGTKAGEEKAESIWNLISPYVSLAQAVFKTVNELTDEIILEAMKHAYVLGMLVAEHYSAEKPKKHVLGSRAEIDSALKHLAESSKDYQNPPKESAMCYSIRTPEEVSISFICSNCGRRASMDVYKGSEDIINEYRELSKKFIAIGHKAEVMCYCDVCAEKLHPSYSSWRKNNIVFAFTAKGSNTPVYSFPSTWRYNDFEYQVTLAFLNGADTIEQLSEDTDSKRDSDEYLKHVRTVIGTGR